MPPASLLNSRYIMGATVMPVDRYMIATCNVDRLDVGSDVEI